MLAEQSSEQVRKYGYRVHINFKSREHFNEILESCREIFGHRGQESGWWWNVQGRWRDKKAVFKFKNGEDAIMFKLKIGIR